MPSKIAHLTDLLKSRAERSPDSIAYTFFSDDLGIKCILTYAALCERAEAIGAAIRARCSPGDRVLLSFGHGPDFISTFFACLYARVIAVPIKPIRKSTDESRTAALSEDCGATIGITSSDLLLSHVSSIDRAGRQEMSWLTVDTLLQSHDEAIEHSRNPSTDGTAYLQYTSGSTEHPRGVIISHRNVLSNLAAIDADFRHDSESVGATWLPHFHDMGLVYGLLQPMYNGYPCYVLAPETFARYPLSWLRTISRFRVTHSGAPNFGYEYCARRARQSDLERLDLSSWRVAFNGAEKVRSETLQTFATSFARCGFDKRSFYAAYGLAEATLKVSGGFCLGALHARTDPNRDAVFTGEVPCGWPNSGTEVLIVDPVTLQPTPAGKPGELWVRGPGVACGYWNSSDGDGTTFGATVAGKPASVGGRQCYLRTGDIGFFGNDGLVISGRLKALIIIRGRSYHAEDIEASVTSSLRLGSIPSVCAFSVDFDGEERLVVMIGYRNRKGEEFASTADRIRQRIVLVHGLQVHVVAFADGLPKTSSGKIQRHECKILYLSEDSTIHTKIALEDIKRQPEDERGRDVAQSSYASHDRQELERYILSVISSALQLSVSVLEAERTLSALGADSLGTLALSHSLQEEFGLEIAAETLFDASPVDICTWIVQTSSSGRLPRSRTIEKERSVGGTTWPASSQQYRLWLLQQLSPDSSAYNVAVAFTITGDLNIQALSAAGRSIFASHPVLRSTFYQAGDILVAAEGNATQPIFKLLDLQYSEPVRLEDLPNLIRQEMIHPFDLARGPLFRLTVIRTSARRSVLICTVHHILADLWSMRVLVNNLFAHYERVLQSSTLREDSSLSPIIPFTPDAASRTAASEEPEHIEYWKRQLSDLPSPLTLIGARPRSSRQSDATNARTRPIDDDLRNRTRELARNLRCTEFTVLLAAYALFLRRHSGSEDVIIATPFMHREQAAVRNLIGLFAEPVPIRVSVGDKASGRELIARAKASIAKANEHNSVLFGKLVELAAPERIPGVLPIAQAFMGYYPGILQAPTVHSLSIEPLDIFPDQSDYDISLDFTGTRDRPSVTLRTNADLFGSVDVDRLLDDYISIVTQMTQAPDASPGDMIANGDEQEVLRPSEDLAVAATFTAEPIAEFLEFWAQRMSLSLRISFLPTARIHDALVAGLRQSPQNITNIFLVRLKDWVHGSISLDAAVAEFLAALKQRADSSAQHLIVCLCPTHSGAVDDPEAQLAIQECEKRLRDELETLPNVSWVSGHDVIERYKVERAYDLVADKLGNIPYTDEFYAALGTAVLRKLLALRTPRTKVLVFDGDNTLWDGIVGEEGVNGVYFNKKTLALHRFLLAKKHEGVLLCLSSKNEEEDVVAVFEQHLELELSLRDFVARQVNWRKKSENILIMARELNLGPESMLFVDDDPIECGEVAAHCPGISTLTLAKSDDKVAILNHYWPLDRGYTTGDRTKMYVAERERREDAARLGIDFGAYIESLNIRYHVNPLATSDLPRVAELLLRTTQFNTTGFKATSAQLHSELERGAIGGFTVRLSDKFGDYGLIGVALLRRESTVFFVDSLLLSCRALGRWVEFKMAAECAHRANRDGLSYVVFRFERTARNRPAEEFLSGLATVSDCQWRSGELRIPVEQLLKITQRDIVSPPVNAITAEKPTTLPKLIPPRFGTGFYEEIARSLNTASAVLSVARFRGAAHETPNQATADPWSPIEREVCAIWADLIGLEVVDRDVGFFEAGGDSLKAVRVVSKIESRFAVTLPIVSFFEATVTVASLASAIEAQLARKG
ncbi:MAG: HAD-IIIC family phosphatase [Acidobacteria bacterium]|nr:HAD-IIIC family phosphatase [Acidobacteriota bacterium]